MTVTCPNGHPSETSDYCDQCGAKINGVTPPVTAAQDTPGAPPTLVPPTSGPAVNAASPTLVPPASAPAAHVASPTLVPSASAPVAHAAPPPTTAPAASTTITPAPADGAIATGDELCPLCHSPRVEGDRFCEGCGYDYTSPRPPVDPAADILAGAFTTPGPPTWEAIVTADREYYDRIAPDGVPFPLHCPPRTFFLAGDQIRIGRRSSSRGIQPEIDLTGAPEDSAISHLHCLLLEQPDGSYSVVDPGSTNGTILNDDPTPMAANVAVALADGDRLHLGAWTTITVHHRPPAGAVGP